LSAASCTTAADGTCSVTLTDANPQNSQSIVVTGTIAGATGAGTHSDAGSKTWKGRVVTALVLSPKHDVDLLLDTHSVTATVTDQFGTAVAGADVDFLIPGPTTTNRNPSGTTGFDKITNASGQAVFTYTDHGGPAAATVDNISAWSESSPGGTEDDTLNGGEPNDTAQKDWRSSVTATSAAIDLVGCNGDTSNFASATWNHTANDTVPDVEEICASAKTADGTILYNHTMSFSSSGVGNFTDSTGTANNGTSTTAVIDAGGRAHVFVSSTQVGSQTITATLDSASDSGTKTWGENDARNIVCGIGAPNGPKTQDVPPGTHQVVRCLVTDRFANPVQDQFVKVTETGVGQYDDTDCFNSNNVCFLKSSGTNGIIEIGLKTAVNEQGPETVLVEMTNGFGGATFTTLAGTQECERAAGDPAGAPAGNCSDTVTLNWVAPPPVATTVDLSPATDTKTVGQNETLVAKVLDQNGQPMAGQTVTVTISGPNAAATGSGTCVTGTTDASGNCTFTFTGAHAGLDSVTATSSSHSDSSAVTWERAVRDLVGVSVQPSPIHRGHDLVIRGKLKCNFQPCQASQKVRARVVTSNGTLRGSDTTDATGHFRIVIHIGNAAGLGHADVLLKAPRTADCKRATEGRGVRVLA
jgi:hypothetical protein